MSGEPTKVLLAVGLLQLPPEMLGETRARGMVQERAAGPVRKVAVHPFYILEFKDHQRRFHGVVKNRARRTIDRHWPHIAGFGVVEHLEQALIVLALDTTDSGIAVRLQQVKFKAGTGGLANQNVQDAVRPHRLYQVLCQSTAHVQLSNNGDKPAHIHRFSGRAIVNEAGFNEAERLEEDRVGAETKIGARGLPQRHGAHVLDGFGLIQRAPPSHRLLLDFGRGIDPLA